MWLGGGLAPILGGIAIATMLSTTGFKPVVDYYKKLAIGVSASITDYDGLLVDPAFIAYYRNNEVLFDETVKNILESPEMMLEKAPLDGAVAGVARLAVLGNIRYYTVRKSGNEQRQQEIQQATKRWLSLHHFPAAESGIFCKSVMNKLVRIYQQEKDNQEPLILIDDRWNAVLEAFDELAARDWTVITDLLRQRLTLVAFGVSSLPKIVNGLQVVVLPSWNALDTIYPLFSSRKEFEHASVARKAEDVLEAIKRWSHWNTIQKVAVKEYGITESEFQVALLEYQKFMGLIVLGHRELGMFSQEVDIVWHSHILHTQLYERFLDDREAS